LPAGELLGAGSFGRVYKGRWNNTDVAVKVIQHDAAQAEEVENEVLLMMGLQHECIVAAYHYVLYEHSREAAAAALSAGTAAVPGEGRIVSSSGLEVHDSAHLRSSSSHSSSSNKTCQSAVKKGTQVKRQAESQLVMEYCDRGTLADAAASFCKQQQQQQQQKGCEMSVQVMKLLQDVARGLQAIHSKKVVHGDLVSWLVEQYYAWCLAGAEQGHLKVTINCQLGCYGEHLHSSV
jgi:serine/threonine protein kinase